MGTLGIVIPCYNAGHLLMETVDSVRHQSVQPDAVVIVDDGSTDPTTLELLRSLESEEAWSVIRQENARVAAARNTGIRSMDVDYVLPLDSDDRLLPEAVGLVRDAFDGDATGNLGVVAGGVKHFGPVPFDGPPPFEGIASMLDGTRIPQSSGFRKRDWEEVGGYPEGVRFAEDWAFWMRLLTLGRDVVVLKETLYEYRVTEDSMSGRADPLDVVAARNFVLRDSWPLYAQHPERVITELTELRLANANFRKRYGPLLDLKAKLVNSRLGRSFKNVLSQ